MRFTHRIVGVGLLFPCDSLLHIYCSLFTLIGRAQRTALDGLQQRKQSDQRYGETAQSLMYEGRLPSQPSETNIDFLSSS